MVLVLATLKIIGASTKFRSTKPGSSPRQKNLVVGGRRFLPQQGRVWQCLFEVYNQVLRKLGDRDIFSVEHTRGVGAAEDRNVRKTGKILSKDLHCRLGLSSIKPQ